MNPIREDVVRDENGEIRTDDAAIDEIVSALRPMNGSNDMDAAVALIEKLKGERDQARRLEAEAAHHVEVPVAMYTRFDGEPPYVGWEGVGLAVREVIRNADNYLELLKLCVPVSDDNKTVHIWGKGDVPISELTNTNAVIRQRELELLDGLAREVEDLHIETDPGGDGKSAGILDPMADAVRDTIVDLIDRKVEALKKLSEGTEKDAGVPA